MENLQKLKEFAYTDEVKLNFDIHNLDQLDYSEEINYIFYHLSKNKFISKITTANFQQIVIDLAINGLSLSPALNFAYVAVRNNGGHTEAIYEIGYQGIISRMLSLSNVVDVYAHVTFDQEIFEGEIGLLPMLKHVPYYFSKKLKKDAGAPWGVYAVVVYESGLRSFEFIPAERIEEIRNNADAYKQDKKNGTTLSPWNNEHWEEMWRKTAIKHIYKTIPKSFRGSDREITKDIATLIDHDNIVQGFDVEDAGYAKKAIGKIKPKSGKPKISPLSLASEQAIGIGKIKGDWQEDKSRNFTTDSPGNIKYHGENAAEFSVTTVTDLGNGSAVEKIPDYTTLEVEVMKTAKDGLKQLKAHAKELGILEEIIKNNTGARLSKKSIYKAIIGHYGKLKEEKQEKKLVVDKTISFKGSKEVAMFEENQTTIQTMADDLKNKIKAPGLKSFSKATITLLPYLRCPTKDSEGTRSDFACHLIFDLLEHYKCDDELEKLTSGNIIEVISTMGNEKLLEILQSV